MPNPGNFRKNYLGSLGFQVVQVTPSVETALNESVIDVDRLQKLCYWVRIPHLYRVQVWKVLLGVVSIYRESWPLFEDERRQVYMELRRVCGCLYDIQGDAEEVVLFKMFVALNGGIKNGIQIEKYTHLTSIAKAMIGICDGKSEYAFWLFCGFLRGQANETMSVAMKLSWKTFHQLLHASNPAIPTWMSATVKILKDNNPNVSWNSSWLESICLPWFQSNFSSILPTHCLERIWDIQLGASALGSTVTVPPFIAAAIVMNLIKEDGDLEGLKSRLTESLNKIDSDTVTQQGITLWEESVPGHTRFISTWRGTGQVKESLSAPGSVAPSTATSPSTTTKTLDS